MYEYKAVVTNVVDGDTFDADVDLGFHLQAKLRFRLLGVNTPEKRGEERPEGLRVTEIVKSLIDGKEITVRTHKTGAFGRWLAEVICKDPTDQHTIILNDWLLKNGHAKPYKR